MAKYAVIRLQGQQYRVSEGQEILVDKIDDPKKLEPEVLLVADGEKVEVGKPLVKDAKVSLKVVAEKRAKKSRFITSKPRAAIGNIQVLDRNIPESQWKRLVKYNNLYTSDLLTAVKI